MLRGQELVMLQGVMFELRTETWGKIRQKLARKINWKSGKAKSSCTQLAPLHHVTLATKCDTRNVLKLCLLQNTDANSDLMMKSRNFLLRKFGTSQSTSLAETLREFWRVQLPWRVCTYWCVLDGYRRVIYLMMLIYVDDLDIIEDASSVWSPRASVSRWGPASKAGKPTPTRPTDLPWTCHGLLIAFTALGVLQIYASFKTNISPKSSNTCLSWGSLCLMSFMPHRGFRLLCREQKQCGQISRKRRSQHPRGHKGPLTYGRV